jgi:tetratricopeptide (TPR) repeat protein
VNLKNTELINHINFKPGSKESRWISTNLSKMITIFLALGLYLISLSGCLETTDLSSTMEGQIVLAKTYLEQKNIDSAISVYKKLASSYPESPEAAKALYLAGEAYEDYQNNWETALYTFEHMSSVYPDSEYTDNALFRMACIYDERKNDPSKAKQVLMNILNNYSSGDVAEKTRNKLINIQNRGF